MIGLTTAFSALSNIKEINLAVDSPTLIPIIEQYFEDAPRLEILKLAVTGHNGRMLRLPENTFEGSIGRLSTLVLSHCCPPSSVSVYQHLLYLEIRLPKHSAPPLEIIAGYTPSMEQLLTILDSAPTLQTLTLAKACPPVPEQVKARKISRIVTPHCLLHAPAPPGDHLGFGQMHPTGPGSPRLPEVLDWLLTPYTSREPFVRPIRTLSTCLTASEAVDLTIATYDTDLDPLRVSIDTYPPRFKLTLESSLQECQDQTTSLCTALPVDSVDTLILAGAHFATVNWWHRTFGHMKSVRTVLSDNPRSAGQLLPALAAGMTPYTPDVDLPILFPALKTLAYRSVGSFATLTEFLRDIRRRAEVDFPIENIHILDCCREDPIREELAQVVSRESLETDDRLTIHEQKRQPNIMARCGPPQTRGNRRHHLRTREIAYERVEEQLCELAGVVRLLKVRRNSLLPISRLPAEILGHVFFLIAMDDSNIDDPVASIVGSRAIAAQVRTAITHVCHQWRTIALSHSALWTNVVCITTREESAETLSRSGNLPLVLSGIIDHGPRSSRQAQAIRTGLTALARIEDLALFTTSSAMELLGLESFGPAPQLVSLRLDCQNDSVVHLPSTVFGEGHLRLPRLTRLVLIDCSLSWDMPISSNLVHLELQMQGHAPASITGFADKPTQDQLYCILKAATRLKTLILVHTCPSQPPHVSFKQSQVPRLPHLESLMLRGHPVDVACVYANLHMPATVTVALQLGFIHNLGVQGAGFGESLSWLCMRDYRSRVSDHDAISLAASAAFTANMLSITAADIESPGEEMLNTKLQLSTISGLPGSQSTPTAYREIAASRPFHTLEFQFCRDQHDEVLQVLSIACLYLPLSIIHTLSVEGSRLQTKDSWDPMFTNSQYGGSIHTLYLDSLSEKLLDLPH
ncbi:hypothetical protein EVG20_g5901, partial [Dentipellis fragilis]